MSLGWQVEFKEMTSLRLFQVLHSLFTDTNLNGIDSVLLKSLDLSDLASINLKDGAWHDLTPLVPKVSHSHFIPEEPHSSGIAIRGSSLLELELMIDFVLKACK
jgi:hypothetical protein